MGTCLLGVGVSSCGSPAEPGGGEDDDGDDSDAPRFAGNLTPTPGAGGSSSGAPGTETCVDDSCRTPETVNPSGLAPTTPATQVSQACTANQIWCEGNNLNTCNLQGTGFSSQSCGTNTCNAAAAVPACGPAAPAGPPPCTAGAVTCETANTIGTCGADGTIATTRCPDGTNCTGAGQCTPVQCNTAEMLSTNNGSATVYWFAQGTYSPTRRPEEDINCSFGSDGNSTEGDGDQDRVFNIPNEALFGALNGTQYEDSAACGACVEMSYQGRNVTLTIVDSCLVVNENPVCQPGHIDLSRGAWDALTNNAEGTIIRGITWRYVPCGAASDTVQFQLKTPDDPYWNQFVVVNHRYPIVRAEVLMTDGRWVDALRETYNYWLPPEGAGGEGGDMGTYRVRVTDINGAIIEEQLELRGGVQGGTGQFDCQ